VDLRTLAEVKADRLEEHERGAGSVDVDGGQGPEVLLDDRFRDRREVGQGVGRRLFGEDAGGERRDRGVGREGRATGKSGDW
jgi:hypothetical protein